MWSVADVQHPQRVAGRVVGDPVRKGGADVLDAETTDEKLAQLDDGYGAEVFLTLAALVAFAGILNLRPVEGSLEPEGRAAG